jgi:gas vesicle protein
MNTSMDMKTNGSNIWPYVVVGSAIGGAVGYLFMTERGRKVRHSIAHPDKLASSIEDARDFIERKARVVTDQVHGVLDKAKSSIEAGEHAYHEAEIGFQGQVKSTAVTIEKNVLDPICELGALYKGMERGIRTLLGKEKPHMAATLRTFGN